MAEHFWKRVRSQDLTRFSRTQKTLGGACAAVVVSAVVALSWGGGQGTSSAGAPRPSATPAVTTPSVTATPTPTPSVTKPTPSKTTTPTKTTTPQPTKTATRTFGPMSLSVPAIDVAGPLKRTAAVNGVVNPPSGVLAWITGYGRVRPGEVGTAVVAGHVVNGKNADVFYRLQDVDRGDKVTVYDSDGKPVVYTVTSTKVATKQAVSRDKTVWGANASVRRIALITCDDEDGYRADGHRVANFVAIAEAR